MRGSPFGWATEFAGSARIPAAFNNLFSLKVSSGRLTTLGIASSDSSLPSRNFTAAMMSRDLPFLRHMAKLCLGATAYDEDPMWIDMPWRESKVREMTTRIPTFAILECDGHVRPQPPIQRVLDAVADSLRRANFQVLDWKPPSHAEAAQAYFKIIGADGAQATREHIKASGEPPVPMLQAWYFAEPSPPLQLDEYLGLLKSQESYQAEYQNYWDGSRCCTTSGRPVDGVIMPVCANAACFENTMTYFGEYRDLAIWIDADRLPGYSAIVNLLDFTAVSIPCGFNDEDPEWELADHEPISPADAAVKGGCVYPFPVSR